MHKTLYVDVDEEITSVIDRIKMEEALEIFLVVPKQAMLTQGVINLRILKKEIEKMGKSVMIATSDLHAKKVIEQIGIKIGEIAKDFQVEEREEKESSAEQQEEHISEIAANEVAEKILEKPQKQEEKEAEIGSSSFFDSSAQTEELSSELGGIDKDVLQKKDQEGGTEQMREMGGPVEDRRKIFEGEDLRKELYKKNPNFLISKKSQNRNDSGGGGRKLLHQVDLSETGNVKPQLEKKKDSDLQNSRVSFQTEGQKNFPSGKKIQIDNKDPGVKNLFGGFEQQGYSIKTTNGFGFGKKIDQQKADRFFSAKPIGPGRKGGLLEEEKSKIRFEMKNQAGKAKKAVFWKFALAFLILALALGGIGFWAYSNYPQVEVLIYPQKQELSKEIKIVAKEISEVNFAEGAIPGTLVEIEIEKTMSFDATGEAFDSDDGKARGKVKIYNYFSASEQPLVKTTRVLSKEGKLFRLSADVVVPGMEGEDPGVVEVGVVADKSGDEFNISPSTLTIEGFKGGPKYEKFEVKSENPMAGGGEPDPNKRMTAVTAGDIEKARIATLESFEESLEKDVAEKLGENQKMMTDSIEKEIVSASASHKADDVSNQFSYTVEQKIKGIAFDGADVAKLAQRSFEEAINENQVLDPQVEVVFKKGISDFEAKTLTMYANLKAVAWPEFGQEEIVDGIVGKKESDIQRFLADYPQIDKVEISFNPSWMTTIPVSKEKVKIKEIRRESD